MADKKLRGATRTSVTRAVSSVQQILDAEELDDVQLHRLSNLFTTKLNILDDLDAKILSSWEDDETFEKEAEEIDNYQRTIYVHSLRLRQS